MCEHVVILVTAPAIEEAEAIARRLLEQRLIACANLVAGVRSLFRWEGKIDEADEVLVVMKTRQELLDAVTGAVREMHSYDVCEVIGLPFVGGSEAYLRWVDESVGTAGIRDQGSGNGRGRQRQGGTA